MELACLHSNLLSANGDLRFRHTSPCQRDYLESKNLMLVDDVVYHVSSSEQPSPFNINIMLILILQY